MGRHLQRALAQTDPVHFARVLGESENAAEMLSGINEVPSGLECDVVARLAPEAAERLLGAVDDRTISRWLQDGSTDAGRRLLSRLQPDRANGVVAAIGDRSKRRDLRRLSGYPPGSVGELTETRLVLVEEDKTAQEVAALIRAEGGSGEFPVLVTRADGSVMGVLDPIRVILEQDSTSTASRMCIRVEPLHAGSPTDAIRMPDDWSRLTYLPVVDSSRKPIGFVSRRALESVRADRSDASLFLISIVYLARQYWSFLFYATSWILGRRTNL